MSDYQLGPAVKKNPYIYENSCVCFFVLFLGGVVVVVRVFLFVCVCMCVRVVNSDGCAVCC